MSLYYDAETILSNPTAENGSLKSIIYNDTHQRKSNPATLYALIVEVAKWDSALTEVIENAALLNHEAKLSPTLALLLVHDLLLSKRGIAAPAKHPLRVAVERNKARLQAEFTKTRLRRKCTTLKQLREKVLAEKDVVEKGGEHHHNHNLRPRWVRINTIKTDLDTQLETKLFGHNLVSWEGDFGQPRGEHGIYIDQDFLGLIAVKPQLDLTKSPGYQQGHFILQDRASCFPAYLLLESSEKGSIGDVIDACAAPGNKTTQLAAMLTPEYLARKSTQGKRDQGPSSDGPFHKEFTAKPTLTPARQTRDQHHKVFACERDPRRSKTLEKMVETAGATELVTVLPRQDFLAINPEAREYHRVTHLLLDPSCSGSGILDREDIPHLALPADPRLRSDNIRSIRTGNKRKRSDQEDDNQPSTVEAGLMEDYSTLRPNSLDEEHIIRLNKLSSLQLRIIEHAFAFPAASVITYSTCSIHVTENERVVSRALQSRVARDRGWMILSRECQPRGLQQWKHRGVEGDHGLNSQQLDACVRCYPNDEYGTMGFFVCGFVRRLGWLNIDKGLPLNEDTPPAIHDDDNDENEEEEEWEGFSDAEGTTKVSVIKEVTESPERLDHLERLSTQSHIE